MNTVKQLGLRISLLIALCAVAVQAMAQDSNFTLQILHASDLEGGVEAIGDAPNFAAVVEALEADAATNGIPSILLSSGDNYLTGPFYNASSDFGMRNTFVAINNELFTFPDGTTNSSREAAGRTDVTIMNILGFDASVMGNHEFDAGTSAIAEIIGTDIRNGGEVRWLGAQFPYLSANLDFSNDSSLSRLYTSDILMSDAFASTPADLVAAAAAPKIAPATIIDVDGEKIGIVGATTQLLNIISSPGNTAVIGGDMEDMNVLAGILNPVIAKLAMETDKIILVSHLQQFSLEQELVGKLNGVDIILAGGSDTLSADATDVLRAGDVAAQPYPFLATNAEGNDVAIVSTDGQYSYVGRMVVEFDMDGNIVPSSVDEAVSGSYATDEASVAALTADPFADGSKAAHVKMLTEAVNTIVVEKDGNIAGSTNVYLDGNRSAVRTEETNLGNLTADANLATAQELNPNVVISIKNGGGIRAPIGESTKTLDGQTVLTPPSANIAIGKMVGEISQLDIENTLKFNNELTTMTVTAEGLREILEHAVADSGNGNTPGRFPQISGLRFSYDLTQPAVKWAESTILTPGSRIVNVAVVDKNGQVIDKVVENGFVTGDPKRTFDIVTLSFLAGGGDGYPFPAYGTNIIDTGIGEQSALFDYLTDNYSAAPYSEEEMTASADIRIQNLALRQDTVFVNPTAVSMSQFETSTTSIALVAVVVIGLLGATVVVTRRN